MALISDPTSGLVALRRVLRKGVRRLLGVPAVAEGEGRRVPDDMPRDGLFTQPLVVDTTAVEDPEVVDTGTRVTFRVLVRDADGRRCPDVHVEARVVGPEREAVGETTTDMLGAARFRMAGPPGTYRIEVLEVAALALDWDRATSTTTASLTVA